MTNQYILEIIFEVELTTFLKFEFTRSNKLSTDKTFWLTGNFESHLEALAIFFAWSPIFSKSDAIFIDEITYLKSIANVWRKANN